MLNKEVYDILENAYLWKIIKPSIRGKVIHTNFINEQGDVLSVYEDVSRDAYVEVNGRRYKAPTKKKIQSLPTSDDNVPKLQLNEKVARFIDMMTDKILNNGNREEQFTFLMYKGKRA